MFNWSPCTVGLWRGTLTSWWPRPSSGSWTTYAHGSRQASKDAETSSVICLVSKEPLNEVYSVEPLNEVNQAFIWLVSVEPLNEVNQAFICSVCAGEVQRDDRRAGQVGQPAAHRGDTEGHAG